MVSTTQNQDLFWLVYILTLIILGLIYFIWEIQNNHTVKNKEDSQVEIELNTPSQTENVEPEIHVDSQPKVVPVKMTKIIIVLLIILAIALYCCRNSVGLATYWVFTGFLILILPLSLIEVIFEPIQRALEVKISEVAITPLIAVVILFFNFSYILDISNAVYKNYDKVHGQASAHVDYKPKSGRPYNSYTFGENDLELKEHYLEAGETYTVIYLPYSGHIIGIYKE